MALMLADFSAFRLAISRTRIFSPFCGTNIFVERCSSIRLVFSSSVGMRI